jgi:hypothetical protein
MASYHDPLSKDFVITQLCGLHFFWLKNRVCLEDDGTTNKKDYLALYLQVWQMLERLMLALANI